MNLYEFVFIIRQDVSSTEVDRITSSIMEIITAMEGEIIKKEYRGLRTLAYQIKGNNKGNYMFIGMKASPECLKELERKLSLSDFVIRHVVIKVKEISNEASPILKSFNVDDASVNVTG